MIFKDQIEKYSLQRHIKREMAIQTSVHHPNVLTLYGWFHDSERIFLILEYAHGGDPYGELPKSVHLYKKQAANVIFLSISLPLSYIHISKSGLLIVNFSTFLA